jgi:ATP-dependent exoDNAse (exonuclease V) beta subunit
MKHFNHVNIDLPSIKQVNLESKRLYETATGNKYPSVTTVLSAHNKDAIIAWRKRVGNEEANRISAAATRRGTKIHSIIESYLKNEDRPIENNLDLNRFISLEPYLENIDNIHVQERPLYSDHLRLAGTVDCIAEYDGRLSVIDFKTASKAKKKEWIHSYFMQCAAYAIMYEERTKRPITNLVIMISVEDDAPQIFFEKRDNWVKDLLYYRDLYEQNNSY